MRRTTAQKPDKPKKPTYREKLFSGTPCLVAPKQQAFTTPACDDIAATISYVATYLEASGPKAFSSLAKETGIPEGRLNPLLESATQFARDARGFWRLKSQLEGL